MAALGRAIHFHLRTRQPKTTGTNYKSAPMKNKTRSFATSLIRLGFAMILAFVGVFEVTAQETISVKFTSPKNSNQNWMYASDYAGAPGVRTNNWNNLLASADGNSSPITLAAGTVSNSAGAILPNFWIYAHPTTSGGGGGVYNRTAGGTNDGKMFADVSDTYGCTGFGNFGYIDFTNIPYTNYNIYCYFRPDSGNGSANTRGGFFIVTNTPGITNRLYLQNQSNDVAQTQEPDPSTSGANYVQSQTTGIPSGGAAWSTIQGGNYVEFSGLTNSWTRLWFGGLGNGSGAKDDLGNYVNGGSAAVRFKVAGFQIVQINPGQVTNIFFTPASTTLHAGNPGGTQSIVDGATTSGQTNNITALCAFSSDNTNIVNVSTSGVFTPGTNGTAHVIASYQGLFATNTVTVVAPTALWVSVAKTNLLVGNGKGDGTTATLYANFSDATNIIVNSYQFVSYSSSGAATITTNGIIWATNTGLFSITGIYDGLAATTNNVGSVAFWSAPGTVQTFSVHLTDSTNNTYSAQAPNDGMTFHDLSGVTGTRVGYWNNMVMQFGAVTNEIDNPVDYQGNVLTNVVVQVLPNNTPQQGISLGGTRTTNESVMFNTPFDQGANNGVSQQSFIVISNIPYATYDVYFYFQNDNSSNGTNRPGQVTIDGVTQYRINSMSYPTTPDNSGNGYVQAVQPGSFTASIASVPYGNFIKFSSLTDPVLNVTWGAVGQDIFGDAAVVTRTRLAGFQIVQFPTGTVTNIYLQSAVPNQLPGNPAAYNVTVLADFSGGTHGYPITSFCSFASSDTTIFNVDANGSVTPGLNPGTATLTVTYQSNTLLAGVTNLAPSAVRVTAIPGTVYLDGSLYNSYGLIQAQASAHADFPGFTNVNISAFNSISFVDQGSPVCSLAANGAISPNAVDGSANLGVSYIGNNYVSANAFSVASIADAPVLKHQYLFTNAPSSSVVVDTVGSANGTVHPPLGSNKPISFDGSHVIFPGDAGYTNEPYINLTPGVINQMGDVTIEMWGGVTKLNAWARFLSFGTTGKGLDPHNYGGEISILELLASYSGTGEPAYFTPFHLGDARGSALTNGAEYHVVMIYAPNAGTNALYINGVFIGGGTPTNGPVSSSVNDTVDWLGVSLANDDAPLAGWMNKLAIYEGALSPAQISANYSSGVPIYLPLVTVNTNPTNVIATVTGSTLNLSWPADHQGWRLQVQTNALNAGLGTNWVTVPGSTNVNNQAIPMNPANGAVYYRLVYP